MLTIIWRYKGAFKAKYVQEIYQFLFRKHEITPMFLNFYSSVLRFGGKGEMTHINGPPNTPLYILAHLCFITYMYITLQCKAREMKNYYFHIGDERTCIAANTSIIKGNRIIEQKVAG